MGIPSPAGRIHARPAHPGRDRLHALERGVAGELDRLRGSHRGHGLHRRRDSGLHARADRVIERVKRRT